MRRIRAAIWVVGLCPVHCGPGTDGATSGTSTGSSAGSDTGTSTGTAVTSGGGPDPCVSSDECVGGGACVNIPCSLSPAAGCDTFRCIDACGSPHDETGAYGCVDGAGCCSDSFCSAGRCVHESSPETTSVTTSAASTSASTGDGLSTGDGDPTGGPPACAASSDCAGDGRCLLKPCEVVRDEPGCGEFRCYAECSDPFTETGLWTCADEGSCCGGYPCIAGMCTEFIGSTT